MSPRATSKTYFCQNVVLLTSQHYGNSQLLSLVMNEGSVYKLVTLIISCVKGVARVMVLNDDKDIV